MPYLLLKDVNNADNTRVLCALLALLASFSMTLFHFAMN